MAPRKKAAEEVVTPIPAPDVPGAPALPDNAPDEAGEDDSEATLAALALDSADAPEVKNAEADPPTPDATAASAPAPDAPALSPSSVIDEAPPALTEEQIENIRLKKRVIALEAEVSELQERIGETRSMAQAEIEHLQERLAGASHKPPPAAVPMKDPLREAKSFGVLATWLGPGMYGGPYFTVAGVQMPHAMGLTIGYFPAADIARSPEQFKKAD